MDREVWKPIRDFPGYEVSSHGRIRGFRDFHGTITENATMLKPRVNKDGYYELTLYTSDHKKITKRVHRVVAETYLGVHPGLVVNHINGNKLDNRVSNLEFVTAAENSTLASESDLYRTKTVRIVETGKVYKSIRECAEALDAHPSDISHCLAGTRNSVRGFHFEIVGEHAKPFLYPHQAEAVEKMRDGCILNGGVGTGKSRTGLYYYFKEHEGAIEPGEYIPMENPRDLYIITTARKRDTLEWEGELCHFLLSTNPELSYYPNLRVVVDSWNNIKKYGNVYGAFFIFDEDRVTGSGVWVKTFLRIAKRNRWIILSASPGDSWKEYIPVFIANGFYRTKKEFEDEHVVYSRFAKYPQIDKYINTGILERHRRDILVDMAFERHTVAHHEDVYCDYDKTLYKQVTRTRWDIYRDEPIQQASGLCYILRRIVNSDESRQAKLLELLEDKPRAIIFYNFDYELDILKSLHYGKKVKVAEWNGHRHEPVPETKRWVYLVQYTAGAEGWNCIKTDTIIFFSQNYSYKIMQQSAGRIDRLNTPYKDLYYYHLKTRSGIDLAISRALANKKKFNESRWVKW